MTAWNETPAALNLLAEIDACERSADAYSGRAWIGVAEAFTARAKEAEDELEVIRDEAVIAFANATGHTRWSDGWDEVCNECHDLFTTVEQAVQEARRLHFGDGLFENLEVAA